MPAAGLFATRKLIAALASEEPVEMRLNAVGQKIIEATDALDLRLEYAALASLTAKWPETEAALTLARSTAPPRFRGRVEMVAAMTLLERGHHARAAGAIERAERAQGFGEDDWDVPLAALFRAQVLLLEHNVAQAVEEARAGLKTVPKDQAEEPLGVYACLIAAETMLEVRVLAEAEAYLMRTQGSPGRTGLLKAQAEILESKLALWRPVPELHVAWDALERALPRLTHIGAPRLLGLAYLIMAQATAADEDSGGQPASWLAQARPLLERVERTRELEALRSFFRTFGRREVDHVVGADIATATDSVRAARARLRDLLSARRDEKAGVSGLVRDPLEDRIEASLDDIYSGEEELISALERILIDRERVGQLVSVSGEIVSIEDVGELVATIPRLALTLIQADTAELLEFDDEGRFKLLSRVGSPLDISEDKLITAAQTALRDGGVTLFGRGATVPLRQTGRNLCMVVEAHSEGEITTRDGELLAILGSLADTALARADSTHALREAAGRATAIVEAIRDGVVATDEKGYVRSVNEAAARLLSLRRARAIGQLLADLPGMAPLAQAVGRGRSAGEVVNTPGGEVLVRSRSYEGGTVATIQELAAAQRAAHKLVSASVRFTFDDLIGADPKFKACLESARRAASSDVTVLITGESGTGKEMLAQAVHNASPRTDWPFVGINVAAIPRELLESELFGYERGAFTGAKEGGKPGKFVIADQGTVLLDEIGEMPLEMQAKLLRVLQERVVQRLGGTKNIEIRARVIATTHRDLKQLVEEGTFRLDLYHRLRVVHLQLPPLRQRREDIPVLAEHILGQYSKRMRRAKITLSSRMMNELMNYDWPGNVRELANVLDGEASLLQPDDDVIEKIPTSIIVNKAALEGGPSVPVPTGNGGSSSPGEILPLAEIERRAIEQALVHFSGNVAKAARALGVAKGTVYNKMKRHGLKE